jgi:hypothetical protein
MLVHNFQQFLRPNLQFGPNPVARYLLNILGEGVAPTFEKIRQLGPTEGATDGPNPVTAAASTCAETPCTQLGEGVKHTLVLPIVQADVIFQTESALTCLQPLPSPNVGRGKGPGGGRGPKPTSSEESMLTSIEKIRDGSPVCDGRMNYLWEAQNVGGSANA